MWSASHGCRASELPVWGCEGYSADLVLARTWYQQGENRLRYLGALGAAVRKKSSTPQPRDKVLALDVARALTLIYQSFEQQSMVMRVDPAQVRRQPSSAMAAARITWSHMGRTS